MRILVDYVRCEGHGLCEQAAPEIFQLDEDGELHLRQDEVDPASEPAAAAAIRVCPVAALSLQQ